MISPDPVPHAPKREPVLNAPWPVLVIAASIPALYYLQTLAPGDWRTLAFAPADLEAGRWGGVFTCMLVHTSWAHAVMNAVAALAFGAPVARLLRGGVGAGSFFLFYIGSGVAAALGYALVNMGDTTPAVGASGAVFGLIGASTRLLGGHGRVMPLTARPVVLSALAWMAVNLFVGLMGFAPGLGEARIAWEAHAFGFLAGILLIGPLGRLFAPRDRGFASSPGKDDPDP